MQFLLSEWHVYAFTSHRKASYLFSSNWKKNCVIHFIAAIVEQNRSYCNGLRACGQFSFVLIESIFSLSLSRIRMKRVRQESKRKGWRNIHMSRSERTNRVIITLFACLDKWLASSLLWLIWCKMKKNKSSIYMSRCCSSDAHDTAGSTYISLYHFSFLNRQWYHCLFIYSNCNIVLGHVWSSSYIEPICQLM